MAMSGAQCVMIRGVILRCPGSLHTASWDSPQLVSLSLSKNHMYQVISIKAMV